MRTYSIRQRVHWRYIINRSPTAQSRARLDPQLLQARWVLRGVAADEWVDQAVSALDEGFDGTALRQLAGLMNPTQRDLGSCIGIARQTDLWACSRE
jgi:hypothetical protein